MIYEILIVRMSVNLGFACMALKYNPGSFIACREHALHVLLAKIQLIIHKFKHTSDGTFVSKKQLQIKNNPSLPTCPKRECVANDTDLHMLFAKVKGQLLCSSTKSISSLCPFAFKRS